MNRDTETGVKFMQARVGKSDPGDQDTRPIHSVGSVHLSRCRIRSRRQRAYRGLVNNSLRLIVLSAITAPFEPPFQ